MEEAQSRGKSNPPGEDEELFYPLDEELQNYIVFLNHFPQVDQCKDEKTQRLVALNFGTFNFTLKTLGHACQQAFCAPQSSSET